MLQLGTAAGASIKANAAVVKLRDRVERLRLASATLQPSERLRAAIIEWTDPLMLAGNWVPELIELAGGQCELTPPGQHSRIHAWQELQQFDPHVIVICPCGFDRDRAGVEATQLAKREEWKNLAAVKSHRVHAIDGNAYFNRPGPRLVESAELLTTLLHPAGIQS